MMTITEQDAAASTRVEAWVLTGKPGDECTQIVQIGGVNRKATSGEEALQLLGEAGNYYDAARLERHEFPDPITVDKHPTYV